jgi:hypothetical protein
VIQFLADNNFGDTRSGGLAGPMGLLLVIVLATATVLLIRNMSKRIKRLPSSFDGADKPPRATPDAPQPAQGPTAQSQVVDSVERAKPAGENLP